MRSVIQSRYSLVIQAALSPQGWVEISAQDPGTRHRSILVQPPDIGSRCYIQAPMRPDAGVRTNDQGNCNSRKLNDGHVHFEKSLKCRPTDCHFFSPGSWKSGTVIDNFDF